MGVGMSKLDLLQELRSHAGPAKTSGLTNAVIEAFLITDPDLGRAIEAASQAHQALKSSYGAEFGRPEIELITSLQEDYVNFYADDCVNPYVALAAVGPWVITAHGAVLHDSGGYGMLGLGHAPQEVLDTMHKPWVMANVMTPSFTHKRLADRLRKEIGRSQGSCPFSRFLCLNSGSESVTMAGRLSDVNAKRLTAPGARHAGKRIKFMGLQGAFHGRTGRPAQVSDSSLPAYRKHLASFSGLDNLVTIPPNNVEALHQAFDSAEQQGVFIEALFVEPVMGEGNPGLGITRAFYDAARARTLAHDSLLLVDSIQAGLRAHGCLSIIDYPGFEGCKPPDMETYSKALNAGQYPLSVLAMTDRAASFYERGIYGNTMTTNPRALEVACTVLDQITPELRGNIRSRGAELVERLLALQAEMPDAVLGVQGTGLLLSAELNPDLYTVIGFGGVEETWRVMGIGVIHGGTNSLRFTPHFRITSEEVQLIVDVVREALVKLR